MFHSLKIQRQHILAISSILTLFSDLNCNLSKTDVKVNISSICGTVLRSSRVQGIYDSSVFFSDCGPALPYVLMNVCIMNERTNE